MSNKAFAILIILLIIGAGGYALAKQASKPREAIIGISHADQGEEHIAQGQKHKAYNSKPASSGPHYNDNTSPAPWGVYTQEVPPEVFLHNAEHGGVIVTYRPDLPGDQLKKLQALFAPPYSNKKFSPNKAIVTPRSENTRAIQLASWLYTFEMDQFDEATLMKFYRQRVGKAPEPSAGPTNTPINQAAK